LVAEGQGIILRHVKGGHFIGEIADGNSQRVVLLKPAGIDAHGAAGAPVVVEGDAGHGADFAEGAVALVVKDEVLHGVIGYNQIELTVVVVINPRGAGAPVVGGARDTGWSGYVLEFSGADVSEQMIAAHRCDKHVAQSIVVVVADGDAHAVKTDVEAGTRGD